MSRSLRAAVVIALALLLVGAWLPWSQEAARAQSEAGLRRALVTYAAARAINGVISVAQSTEVSVQPAGIGVASHPGEILDPLNDLIEQFSSLMLMASVAFGVQLLLAEAGAHPIVSAALSLAIVACVANLVRTGRSPQWLARLLVALLLVRFAVPVSVMASEGVHRALFEGQYAASIEALEGVASGTASTGAVASEPERGDGHWWSDWLPWSKTLPDEAKAPKEATDGVISRMQAFFRDGVQHVVKLAALFVVQTLVLPLVLLWLLFVALRSAASGVFGPAPARSP